MTDKQKEQAAWLKSYAKSKPIYHFGGRLWGINRKRCTLIEAETIDAMVEAGLAVCNGNQLKML